MCLPCCACDAVPCEVRSLELGLIACLKLLETTCRRLRLLVWAEFALQSTAQKLLRPPHALNGRMVPVNPKVVAITFAAQRHATRLGGYQWLAHAEHDSRKCAKTS